MYSRRRSPSRKTNDKFVHEITSFMGTGNGHTPELYYRIWFTTASHGFKILFWGAQQFSNQY